MPQRWLFKTEPTAYSFDRLEREKKTTWDGVKNPVARKHLGGVKRGDLVFIYHTGDEKAVVGTAKALSDAYPDPNAGDPKAAVVDIAPVERLAPAGDARRAEGAPVARELPARPPPTPVGDAGHRRAMGGDRAPGAALGSRR